MFIVKEQSFDPSRDDIMVIKEYLIQVRSIQDYIIVDWEKSPLAPQDIIQYYLPLVEFAHELEYRVEAKIPLILMSRFAYDANPIVFCGHTMNPFAFDDVKVILNKK